MGGSTSKESRVGLSVCMVEVVLDASRRRHWTDSLNQFERTDQLKGEKEGPPFTALTHIPAGISTAIVI